MSNSMVMYDEEFQEINVVIERLLQEANAKVIFLVDKNGQLISGVGDTERFDTTSLASLTASVLAPLYAWFFTHEMIYVVILSLMTLMLIYRHKKNITNLLAGKESKIGKSDH